MHGNAAAAQRRAEGHDDAPAEASAWGVRAALAPRYQADHGVGGRGGEQRVAGWPGALGNAGVIKWLHSTGGGRGGAEGGVKCMWI